MTLIFARERDTKNTVRFQEVVAADSAPVVGTLYVQKHALPKDQGPIGAIAINVEFYADVDTASA